MLWGMYGSLTYSRLCFALGSMLKSIGRATWDLFFREQKQPLNYINLKFLSYLFVNFNVLCNSIFV
jgi:hypothetical protein